MVSTRLFQNRGESRSCSSVLKFPASFADEMTKERQKTNLTLINNLITSGRVTKPKSFSLGPTGLWAGYAPVWATDFSNIYSSLFYPNVITWLRCYFNLNGWVRVAHTEPSKHNQTSKSCNTEISCSMQLPMLQYKADLDMHSALLEGHFFWEERLDRGFTVTTTASCSMRW